MNIAYACHRRRSFDLNPPPSPVTRQEIEDDAAEFESDIRADEEMQREQNEEARQMEGLLLERVEEEEELSDLDREHDAWLDEQTDYSNRRTITIPLGSLIDIDRCVGRTQTRSFEIEG